MTRAASTYSLPRSTRTVPLTTRPKTGDRQQQGREAEEDVHHAADQVVDPASVVAADQAQHHADDSRDRHSDDRHEQTQAAAAHDSTY